MEFSSQNAHTGHRVVQLYGGAEIPGFLQSQAGTVSAPIFAAHYPSGTVEQFTPVPVPDTRDKSKPVRLPGSFKTFAAAGYTNGGRYSGQMRRVVQCRASRGLESPYGYAWGNTHGILEYPYPRVIGSTPGQEATLAAQRRYWLIEISEAGVFAAPFTFGLNCFDCGKNLGDYLESAGANLNLAWAYVNKNPAGAVLQLLTPAQIAAAYAVGSPWYSGCGWAFSASGRAAANVVAKTVGDGIDNNLILDSYETRLITISFDVAVANDAIAIELLVAGTARAVLAGHGIAEGGLAIITGAAQPEYNGVHVVRNVTPTQFEFSVTGSPATPATGDVRLANPAANATLSANLNIGTPGNVTFRRGTQGTLWAPSPTNLFSWNGIVPQTNTFACDGAVHVFYDGEDQVVTRWKLETESVAQVMSVTGIPSGNNWPPTYWNGSPNGTHYAPDDRGVEVVGPLCQYGSWPDCSLSDRPGFFGSGIFTGAYSMQSHGFYGPFEMSVDTYTRTRQTSASVQAGARYQVREIQGNTVGPICASCGGGIGAWRIIQKQYNIRIDKTLITNNETASGTSALMLFASDREAVSGYRAQRNTNNRLTDVSHYEGVHSYDETGIQWPPNPLPPITDFTRNMANNVTGLFGHDPTITNQINSTDASFYLRAAGGINLTIPGALADLQDFVTWTKNVKESAVSGMYFMRGGLKYSDPNLSPQNQIRNSVLRVNSQYTIEGGFAQITPTGKFPASFIGQV